MPLLLTSSHRCCRARCWQADLSEPLALNFPDGHVMSFEVAEHLAVDDEETFVDNIVKFCIGRLLLSWALPAACAPGLYVTSRMLLGHVSVST